MANPEAIRVAQKLFYLPEQSDFAPPHPIVTASILRYIALRAGREGEGYSSFSLATYELSRDELEMTVEHTKRRALFQQPLYGRVCVLLCNSWAINRLEYIVPDCFESDQPILKRASSVDITDLEASGELPNSPYAGRFPVPEAVPISRIEANQLETLLSFEQQPVHGMAM